jgi:hypothetical protein
MSKVDTEAIVLYALEKEMKLQKEVRFYQWLYLTQTLLIIIVIVNGVLF